MMASYFSQVSLSALCSGKHNIIPLTFRETEFQDGLRQRLAAYTEAERYDWIKSIQSASYGQLRKQLQMLREKIEKRKDATHDVDVEMVRLQVGKEIGDLINF